MACLDTSTLLDLAGPTRSRRCRAARDRVRELRGAGEPLFTTRFNVAEVLVGVARSAAPANEDRKVQRLPGPLGILEFDPRAARLFGRIVAHLQEQGTPIGDMDALIASVCLGAGQRIVTRNTRHFARVPGLAVDSY